ncbi:acyl-CoA dehydrogenase family protein [Lysinibacillus xylanilyticus]|uniref:Acyl-CoA dehydrogenase family protein n=1 Tax=Lysinibacillus xylanilyticus TaxID=582475 RepID=A0ABT4EKN0_9BACI|nr:acyl-CoA dehydrogenase family protein [Lysinibacillus xylanilyticus]MCY9545553.1 acyl-CoA dehydrogenase family protein [Lysinibacillus xylanilyticus]
MFHLPTVQFTPEQDRFRLDVRTFLKDELAKGTFTPKCDSWLSGDDPEFSKLIGQKGWIGFTWPKKYGGQERSTIDRYILTEEFLAVGAPVAAHWFADRQTGPLLLRYGTEEQREYFLPKIVKGECYFGIGLSEPNSGSDLASVSTRAEKVEGGWIVNGQKIWTSNAHLCHYMVTLVRTSPFDGKSKHAGLSQLIVDLHAEGITVVPIKFLTGEHHYNEVFFDNVFVPDNMVVGEIGNGWAQGLAELAFERSGPERIMSTFPLIDELIQELKRQNNLEGLQQASKIVARLWGLRNLSIGVAQLLESGNGEDVSIPAALVKALGTKFEQSIPEITRLIVQTYPTLDAHRKIDRFMAESILHAPGFTIRGGTSEVLYGVVAKGVVAQ